MLVLSRKRGERIFIGDDIAVVVVRLGSGAVKLGIDAPREIPIHRDDAKDWQPRGVYRAIQRGERVAG